MLKKVHHICFMVLDLDEAIESFENAFGISVFKWGRYENVEVALFKVGDIFIEFSSLRGKLRGDIPIPEGNKGFFHIAYEVPNLEEAIEKLRRANIPLLDPEPTIGFDWKLIRIDPKYFRGIYIQLIEKTSVL